jgi:hypothetical protein
MIPIERLRARASRGEYASMVPLARAFYDQGSGPRDVLRQCYRVDFPEELFVISDAWPSAQGLAAFTNQPWQLAIPYERGGPARTPDSLNDIERRLFVRDPDLVPLARLADLVVCYRLTELEHGDSTVFRIRRTAAPDDDIQRFGESLLAILHEHHSAHLRRLEREIQLPSNRGAGSLSEENLAMPQALVERVELLRREVAARQSHR